MLSVADIKKLIQVFVTKQEFEHKIEEIKENMATKDSLRSVETKVDAVYGELVAMRQEREAHF